MCVPDYRLLIKTRVHKRFVRNFIIRSETSADIHTPAAFVYRIVFSGSMFINIDVSDLDITHCVLVQSVTGSQVS